MVENALRIGLDSIFPPADAVPHNYKYNIPENALHYNKFELIFDEDRDGPEIIRNFTSNPNSTDTMINLMGIQEDQQEYD